MIILIRLPLRYIGLYTILKQGNTFTDRYIRKAASGEQPKRPSFKYTKRAFYSGFAPVYMLIVSPRASVADRFEQERLNIPQQTESKS